MSLAKRITVELSEVTVFNLEALTGTKYGPRNVAEVLAQLADHAQQAVYRPGAWERDWLIQAFGDEWLKNIEPDPRYPDAGWMRPIKAPGAGAGPRGMR